MAHAGVTVIVPEDPELNMQIGATASVPMLPDILHSVVQAGCAPI